MNLRLKVLHEKMGLWAQAELLCNSEKCDQSWGRGFSPPLWKPSMALPCRMTSLEVPGDDPLGRDVNLLASLHGTDDEEVPFRWVFMRQGLEWSLRRTGVPGCTQSTSRNV